MKERPIPYSPEMMVERRALRKTQTRRLIRYFDGSTYARHPDRVAKWKLIDGKWWAYPYGGATSFPIYGLRCPYGAPGDYLWTKERHCLLDVSKTSYKEFGNTVWNLIVEYSDGSESGARVYGKKPKQTRERGETGWRPAMFMPRWASRGLDEVVDIRIERLQQITDREAIKEGAEQVGDNDGAFRAGFEILWDKINAKRAPWSSNPWVWVITFRRIR